jgi:uncharacterized YigZ family protein
MTYFNLAKPYQIEYEVKRSKFIACAHQAYTREQALQALELQRTLYPDARHHCWAYLLGSPFQAVSMAMYDDGEPSGTAGKPILNVLQHQDIGNIMIIVVRYFGGVKLGAGGLVRAYSSAAQLLIDSLEKIPYVAKVDLTLHCEFSQEQYIRHLAKQFEGEVKACEYQQAVRITVSLPEQNVEPFQNALPK